MRFESRKTTITYGGTALLVPGQHFGANAWSSTRTYTTQARAVLGADTPHLSAHGNAQGSFSFAVVEDFQSPEEAMLARQARQAYADNNPLGVLEIAVGEQTESMNAGLTRYADSITFPPGGGCRLTAQYTFILA